MIPLKDTIPSREKPFVTLLIISINVLIFVFQTTLPTALVDDFIQIFGFVPHRLTYALQHDLMWGIIISFFSIFTSMFLHGSWMHLIGNMWSLWLFGDNVEDRMGHFKFFIFYILSGFFAAITHYIFNFNSPIVTVGASGAIAGVMGAYFVMFPLSRIITLIPVFWLPFFIEIPAVIFIGFWFISQVSHGILTLFGPVYAFGIAWWAHIGGFLFGALTVPLFNCFYML